MRVAVVGASGAVGSRLAPYLAEHGHEVVALGRRRDRLPIGPRIERRAVDISDDEALATALKGCDAAYYLVHSMAGDAHFASRDLELARIFAHVSDACGLKRIVYLGGLGSTGLSDHLTSRQDVGRTLAAANADVVELRAAVVLGPGSISFEMMRYLVERLPVMVAPRWLRTRIQPIAVSDLLRYLAGSLQVHPGVYEIGSDVVTYRELIHRYAAIRGLRRRLILDVPLLSLRLSAYWVDLVTPVDRRVSHALIQSLGSEVVVRDPERTRRGFGFTPMPVDDALAQALATQAHDTAADLFELEAGLHDNVYSAVEREEVDLATAEAVRADLESVGGDLHWYGLAPAWRLRNALGRMVGEDPELTRPTSVESGARVDWWTVVRFEDDALVLRSRRWWPGDGWLGYRMDRTSLSVAIAFRPRGVTGFVYWLLLKPIHRRTTRKLLRHRISRAHAIRGSR